MHLSDGFSTGSESLLVPSPFVKEQLSSHYDDADQGNLQQLGHCRARVWSTRCGIFSAVQYSVCVRGGA